MPPTPLHHVLGASLTGTLARTPELAQSAGKQPGSGFGLSCTWKPGGACGFLSLGLWWETSAPLSGYLDLLPA